MKDWDTYLAPYKQAVDELKVKLKGLRGQYERHGLTAPIEFVTGRVKPVPSILDKARKKHIDLSNLEKEMQDLAAIRIMVPFVDDIMPVVRLLRARKDFEIVEEQDYISHSKKSGYRSYHIAILYPVQTIHGEKKVFTEIQIRTLAMNFWATIEHSLNYKYEGNFPEEIQVRLQNAAEAAYCLDEEMSKIREEIREAQVVFSNKAVEEK